MRILKLAIISFVVFAFIITIISLFIPSTIRISKAVHINAPKDSVILQLSNSNNWHNWYPQPQPFIVLDSVVQNEVKAHYSIKEKNVPTGWKVLPVDNTSAVEWWMEFHLRWYPWEKFSSLLLEKRYGPVMEEGLNNLKNYLENSHSSNK